ncbi:MAG: dihydropteroate synthase [Desulfobulbaceae bacterium]|nr:dihydropteroate synthase [Desulfobulbaceae bacterium]
MSTVLKQLLGARPRRALVMGILNVTPDSFSDGGRFTSAAAIRDQAELLVAAGADLLDIGGESSRPGAQPVPLSEEINRVVAAIQAIRQNHTIPISVDTTKAEVARLALAEGADLINDISALRFDPEMAPLLREQPVPVVIMHMQGTPGNMQQNPQYHDVIAEIITFLAERITWAAAQGIARERIIVDPGLGFGKTIAHNLTILKHLDRFRVLGCPLLIGHSRKAFIGKILDLEVGDRDPATAILAGLCARQGAAIIRVHDVAATVQAVKLAEAVQNAPDR